MDAFRNFVRGWFGKLFLTVVIVALVVTMFWNTSPPGAQGEVAEVDGTPIFKTEVDRAVDAMMARFGDQIDRKTLEQMISRDAVLEELIRRRALIGAARTLGVVADPRTLQEEIRAQPAFQNEQGEFDEARFREIILRNGFANAAAYRTYAEETLLTEQLTGAISDSAFVTRQDMDMLTRMGEQKRDIAWVTLQPAAYTREVAVSDAEVQARYDANVTAWLTPEQFAVDYIEVRLDDYSAAQQVDESAVRAKYDEMVARAGENAERRVAHILIRTDATRSETEAKVRADEVIARLAKGESFAALAAAYSDDSGSAATGGDLGYLSRGVLAPELDSAVAALKVNDVSSPLKSAEGLHLFKVLDVRQVEVPSLESARAGIVTALKRDLARAKYDEVLADLGSRAYEADNLQEPASALGLKLQSTPLFTRAAAPGVLANPKALDELMSADVLEDGRNSAVIDVGEGHALVLRVREHRKPERRPFAEVAAQVRAVLVEEKASLLARDKAAALKAAVAGGQSLDVAAKAAGLTPQRAAGAGRDAAIPRELLRAAFSLPRPAEGRVSVEAVAQADGAHAVLVVDKVVDGTLLGVADDELLQRRIQVGGELGRQDFDRFARAAAAEADVIRLKQEEAGEGKGLGEVIKNFKQSVRQQIH